MEKLLNLLTQWHLPEENITESKKKYLCNKMPSYEA